MKTAISIPHVQMNSNYTYKHIVVVHGIGDQAPNETVLEFMNEFLRALPCQKDRYSVEVHNLIETVDEIKAARQSLSRESPTRSFNPAYIIFHDEKEKTRHVIGFSEVYWKQIPDNYIRQNNGNLPIPIFIWTHSINTRFLQHGRLFHIVRESIDNIEKMLGLLHILSIFYKKSGQFVDIITKFLGDVQFYTESDKIRQEINNRFLSVLARIKNFSEETKKKLQQDPSHAGKFEDFDNCEIYIIAHSEGTVISLNSLVQAALLTEGKTTHPEPEWDDLFNYEEILVAKYGKTAKASSWLPLIKGLVTLGSPIDKHYTIWKHRFQIGHLRKEIEKKICWFNYWDHSDPVGYGLKEVFCPNKKTRQVLPGGTTDAQKLFEVKYDRGFTRYLIPGLAHIKYWKDNGIYEHIIDKVMGLGTTRRRSTEVRSRWWSPFHRVLDRAVYSVSRLATLGALFFFLTHLLNPIRNLPSMDCILPSGDTPLVWTILILVSLLLMIYGLGKIYALFQGLPAKIVYGLRTLLIVAWWSIGAFVFCLCLPVGNEQISFKDWLGHLIGFIVSCLVWNLHTTIHKGLIQMWRYTRGKGTDVRVDKV